MTPYEPTNLEVLLCAICASCVIVLFYLIREIRILKRQNAAEKNVRNQYFRDKVNAETKYWTIKRQYEELKRKMR